MLGRRLAEAGFDLAAGPGTGIARHVIDSFRSVAERGRVRYYLPRPEYMEAAGEAMEPGADEVIETNFDYPMRNVFQVRESQGLFVLTGGDGTLEEVLPALIDYRIPVAIVEGAGSAATALSLLVEVWPDWNELLMLGPSVDALIDEFIERVAAYRRAPSGR